METRYKTINVLCKNINDLKQNDDDIIVIDHIDVINNILSILDIGIIPKTESDNEYILAFIDDEIYVAPYPTEKLLFNSYDVAFIGADDMKPGLLRSGVVVRYSIGD